MSGRFPGYVRWADAINGMSRLPTFAWIAAGFHRRFEVEEVQYDIQSVYTFLLDQGEFEAAEALLGAFKRILGYSSDEPRKLYIVKDQDFQSNS